MPRRRNAELEEELTASQKENEALQDRLDQIIDIATSDDEEDRGALQDRLDQIADIAGPDEEDDSEGDDSDDYDDTDQN